MCSNYGVMHKCSKGDALVHHFVYNVAKGNRERRKAMKNYAMYNSETGYYRVDADHNQYWVMMKVCDPAVDMVDREWVYSSLEAMEKEWEGVEYEKGETEVETVLCSDAYPDEVDEGPLTYEVEVTWNRYWLA